MPMPQKSARTYRATCKTCRWRMFVFCFSLGMTTLVAADGPLNTDDPNYLRRQYAWFQAQEPQRQQQLRKLHAEFQHLPADEQARLTRVMQRYNAWLTGRPEADRQRVLNAPSPAERLEEVRGLREREWVESLPRPYREQYTALAPAARRAKVREWQEEEADRRDEWAAVQRHWVENPSGKLPAVLADGGKSLDPLVAHLRPNLSDAEQRVLDEARAAMDEYGNAVGYVFAIARLTDLHPLLPFTRIGPRNWQDLPDPVKKQLGSPAALPREVRRAQGRWPAFAWALTEHARKSNVTLPPLGDSRREQMPPEVVQFLAKTLEPLLRRSGDAGKADLRALDEAEGKWPDYPRMIMDLARKYRLVVPGWTLPGPPQAWDKWRAARKMR